MGYVTTRVVVEPQNLRSGILVLTVIPGKVGRIQLQDQSAIPFATRGTLWFAMPLAQGDILNIRNIEQGLENLKRVPSADANMELVPTDAVGETDVVIAYKQSLPFHLTLGLDDSGSKATGRFTRLCYIFLGIMYSRLMICSISVVLAALNVIAMMRKAIMAAKTSVSIILFLGRTIF